MKRTALLRKGKKKIWQTLQNEWVICDLYKIHTKQGGHSKQAYGFTDLVQPLPIVWNNPSQSSLRTFTALPSQPYSHLLQSDFRYITNWQSILDCTQFIFKRWICAKKKKIKQGQRCISNFGLYISAEQTKMLYKNYAISDKWDCPHLCFLLKNLPTQEWVTTVLLNRTHFTHNLRLSTSYPNTEHTHNKHDFKPLLKWAFLCKTNQHCHSRSWKEL